MNINKPISFDIEKFISPPSEYAPVYSWIWNSAITEELIEREIDEMAQMGIRGVYIIPEPKEFRPGHMDTPMSPDYLSEGFFALVRHAAQYAAESGFCVWLYDEGGWPSGSACGKVVQALPDCRAKRIERRTLSDFNADAQPYIAASDVISAFDSDGRRLADGDTPRGDVTEYFAATMDTNVPHLADRRAVEEFIRCTYDAYREHMGDMFGKSVFAMFTDEAIWYAPFFIDDVSEFEQKYNWNFADMVPSLFVADSEEKIRFRLDYIEYCMHKFDEVYIEPLHRWCRENSLHFTGHMDGDNLLSTYGQQVGSALCHLRHMDVPGVDVILRQIYPDGGNNFFPRFASSAARQTGVRRALSESFAVYGESLTCDIMRYVCLFQLVRGINIINFMSVTSGRSGFLSAQCRPHFIPTLPQSRFAARFNTWLARMQYLACIGEIKSDVALYMPMRDVWAGSESAEADFFALGKRLEEHGVYFDVTDDDYICTADIADDKLGVGGYEAVFVTDCKYIKEETLARLRDFERSGGAVYGCGFADVTGGNVAKYSLADTGDGNIRVMKCASGGDDVYLFFNEADFAVNTTVKIDTVHRYVYIADAHDGVLGRADSAVTHEFAPGAELVLIASDILYPCAEPCVRGALLCIAEPTDCTVTERYSFEHGAWVRRGVNEKVSPDSWAEGLSGTAVYGARFECESGVPLIVDICGASGGCSLVFNGESVRERIMAPFEFEIEPRLVSDINTLEISVSNTGANALSKADFSEYPPNLKGTYHDKTLEFERISAETENKGKIKIKVYAKG